MSAWWTAVGRSVSHVKDERAVVNVYVFSCDYQFVHVAARRQLYSVGTASCVM